MSADGLTTKDYLAQTLPTDPYRFTHPDLYGYAVDVFVAQCMVERGLEPSPIMEYDWNAPAEQAFRSRARVKTPAEAQESGYHLVVSADRARVEEMQRFVSSQSPEWSRNFDECSQSIRDEELFSSRVDDDLPFSEGLEENAALKDAMARWRECMAPLGVPDLPEDRPGPAPSVMARFGLDGADNLNATDLSSVSAEEIQIAVKDAQCNEESGYDRLAYGLVWAGRDQYVKEHADELAARREQILKSEEALKAYIEANRGKVGAA